MNKKKFVVLALMMIAIIVLSSCMFVACNKDDNGNGSTTDSTKYEETKDLLVKNGDFHVIDTTSTSYPRSLTSWSGAKMYSSGDYKSDVTAGVISLDKALYDANKSKWNDEQDELYNKLNVNGRYDDRGIYKHSLMVYMPEEGKDEDGKTIHGPTAYGYTSTSFTLTKGAYYRLKVDVLTYNIGGDNEEARGARIYVSSNTYAEIKGIDTKGEWKTYEILLEASPVSSTSLNVMLGLGRCTSSDKTGLSTGYAVFDNLILEKLEDTEEETAEKVYTDAVELERNGNEFVATATLKVPNGRFDFGTTTISSSGAPNGWSLVSGNSGKDDPAPSAYRHNGIIDLTKFADNYADYAKQYTLQKDGSTDKIDYNAAKDMLGDIADSIFTDERAAAIAGSNVFMLSQQILTAQSIKSSRTITIERNKTYALSLDIFTYNIHGAGVSLILTGSDGKDIVIKGISARKSEDYLVGNTAITVSGDKGYSDGTVEGNTTGEWRTYTFYIKGNQFKNYSYNINVWLGTEGTNSNTSASCELSPSSSSKTTLYNANGTFSNGWAFIDELKLTECETLPAESTSVKKATDNSLDCEGNDDLRGLIVDLTTTDNLLENILDTTSTDSTKPGVVASIGNGAPTGWKSNYDTTKKTNPVIDGYISEGVVSIENEDSFAHDTEHISGLTYPELPYEIVNKRAYMLYSSSDSYYEVETRNYTVKANNYYRFSFWVKTQDIKSTSGAYIYVLQRNKNADGEYEDDTTLATFSKVNTADYDEYQNDWCEITAVIAGANDKDVEIALKFTLGTGTRWTSSTLAKGAMYVANFSGETISHSTYSNTSTGTYTKSIDLTSSTSYAFTNGSFDDYDIDDDKLEEGKGLEDQTIAATPSDWTISDNKLGANTEESDLVAGVIKFNQHTNDDGTFTFVPSNQAKTVFQYNGDVNLSNFYPTVGKNATELELGSLPGDKGHVLAIGNKTGKTPYAAGFTSSSITLSSNTYYKISLYVKTQGATTATVYLTGESSLTSGTSSFKIVNDGNSAWTKYTFYIEVGQTSVSTKLNLWLGENVDYANIEVTDAEVEAAKGNAEYEGKTDDEIRAAIKAQKAASTGNVFFDNIYYTSIDEADYNKAEEGNEVHKLSFLTDSFDSLSSTIESRGSLSTPNGWTGTTGTNQSSSNTKSGVIYADSAYYEVKNINGVEYVGILGKDYKIDDITVSDKEYDDAKDKDEYKDMDKDQVVEALQKAKLVEMQEKNWIPVSELYAHNNSKQMLVINNMEKSAYTYSGSSVTMKEQSYYEVSVFVRTYGIEVPEDDETVGAFVELYLGSANETDNPFIFKSIRTADDAGFVEYKFYVKTLNEDVTSVSLKLSLGKYTSNEVGGETVVTGLTSGYAMFDDVTIRKIDENDYDAAEESDYVQKRTVSSESKGTGDDDDNNDNNNTTPDRTFNTEALWWMIPTIVLGLLIIIVVIVYIVRKVRKPIAKKKEKKVATPVETPSLDAKRDKYDDNKE